MANLLVPASNLNVLEFAIFLRGAVVGKTRTLILLNRKRLRQCTAVAACYTDMAVLLACGGSSDNYDALWYHTCKTCNTNYSYSQIGSKGLEGR